MMSQVGFPATAYFNFDEYWTCKVSYLIKALVNFPSYYRWLLLWSLLGGGCGRRWCFAGSICAYLGLWHVSCSPPNSLDLKNCTISWSCEVLGFIVFKCPRGVWWVIDSQFFLNQARAERDLNTARVWTLRSDCWISWAELGEGKNSRGYTKTLHLLHLSEIQGWYEHHKIMNIGNLLCSNG